MYFTSNSDLILNKKLQKIITSSIIFQFQSIFP